MGKAQNELSLKREKEGERKGAGAPGDGKGAASKIPHWEGKGVEGPVPSP